MNINKMLYKNRYEINNIFNLLKLKNFVINITTFNKYQYKYTNINIKYMFLYNFVEFDIEKYSNNNNYYDNRCYIQTFNRDLLYIDTNFNILKLFNKIYYVTTNRVGLYYINNKYFMQLLQNILNIY